MPHIVKRLDHDEAEAYAMRLLRLKRPLRVRVSLEKLNLCRAYLSLKHKKVKGES